MVNYTSSASLGGGRFSPSVQYNTPVRMPTQPMPEMPDVNSTFNIDLRPVGQAILGVEELKTKTKLAEREMDLKQELAVQERLHNMAIKRAEWEMKERHHRDDITLGYAKLAAKEQQDSKKVIELNNAVGQYYKELDMLEAELQQEKINYTGYEAAKRGAFDRITSHLQYNTIGSFSDAVNSGRPGAGNIKSAYMRDFDKNAEEARNNAATTEANTIANVSNTLGVPTEEATLKVKNTEQAYLSASKYLENAATPPSIVRDDMKDEYIKSQLQAADRELGIVGGAKVMYDFNKHINEIHRIPNPAEGVEMLRQSFYQSMSGLNVPAARVENLWNIYKNQNNLTKLIENVSGLNKNISDNQKLFINRAIDNKKLSLINDPFIGDFYTTMEAFPTLSKAFANDPSKFSEITDLSNALINASMVKAEPKEDGWKVTLTDGSVISLDKGTVEPLLTEAGTDDVRSALIYSSLRTAWTARNKGDFATSSKIGSNVVTNIRKERATSSQDNMNKMENMNTALNTMDTRYLGDQDENKVLKSAQAKLLSRYGKKGFIDISGKINYMVPDTVWKNSLKGGKIFIFPKTDGTVGIHREQYGFFGGAGRRSFKDKSKEVSQLMANAGLTPEEQITVFRAVLNDDTNMLEIKEKDWEPSLLDRTKIFAQAIIGEPIDIGAELDTKVANFATMLSRVESLQEVADTLSMLGKETKQGLKSSLEGIRDNAGYNGVIREAADEILKMNYLWSDSKLPENTKDYFNASHSVEPTKSEHRAEANKSLQPVVSPTASMTDFDTYPLVKTKKGLSNVITEIVEMDGIYYIKPTMGDTSKHFGGYATEPAAMEADIQMHKELNDKIAELIEQEQLPPEMVQAVQQSTGDVNSLSETEQDTANQSEEEGDAEAEWINAETGKPANLKESGEIGDVSDTIKVVYDGDAEGFSVYTIFDLDAGKAYKVKLSDDTEITYKDLYEMFKSGELKAEKEFYRAQ